MNLTADDVEDCEYCQNFEAIGLFLVDDVDTGLCAVCAEDNDAEEYFYE
ncbi:hypothetical protein ABZW10_28150 [Kitasatospora sp. NPDC004723]